MLIQISIKNFAIFKEATIEPGEGYNVITGESGTGKSVVVNAMSLICGVRAYREMIRTGEDKATVEAVFRIPGHKRDYLAEKYDISDELLVITREIYRERPSVCKINGKIRNLSQISEISSYFIDIHGQYENQNLLDVDNHIKYMDDFAHEQLASVMHEYKNLLKEYNSLTNSILSVSGGDSERERNRQILEFQIDEIDSACLDRIDENALIERKVLLENAEKYRNSTGAALNMLESESNSITDSIRNAVKEMESLPANETIKKTIESLNDSFFQLQDTIMEISRFIESIDFNEKEYDDILDKIDRINDLKRKYGSCIDDILIFRKNAADKLEKIVNFRKDYSRNLERLGDIEKQLTVIDENITKKRAKSSEELKLLLLKELKDMGMKDSVIEIGFNKKFEKNTLGFMYFPKNGRDECEFLISLNKGLAPVTLGKVASGGEMSRIMLSFKTVFSYKDDTESVVFDEIDSGISGDASIAVADKLEKLAADKQIICITHQPQIAARAGNHFTIIKDSSSEITYAVIKKISSNSEKVDIIASLTDGENITREGREHALKILKENNKYFY